MGIILGISFHVYSAVFLSYSLPQIAFAFQEKTTAVGLNPGYVQFHGPIHVCGHFCGLFGGNLCGDKGDEADMEEVSERCRMDGLFSSRNTPIRASILLVISLLSHQILSAVGYFDHASEEEASHLPSHLPPHNGDIHMLLLVGILAVPSDLGDPHQHTRLCYRVHLFLLSQQGQGNA